MAILKFLFVQIALLTIFSGHLSLTTTNQPFLIGQWILIDYGQDLSYTQTVGVYFANDTSFTSGTIHTLQTGTANSLTTGENDTEINTVSNVLNAGISVTVPVEVVNLGGHLGYTHTNTNQSITTNSSSAMHSISVSHSFAHTISKQVQQQTNFHQSYTISAKCSSHNNNTNQNMWQWVVSGQTFEQTSFQIQTIYTICRNDSSPPNCPYGYCKNSANYQSLNGNECQECKNVPIESCTDKLDIYNQTWTAQNITCQNTFFPINSQCQNNSCYNPNCAIYGNKPIFTEDSLTAWDACCGCGGGNIKYNMSCPLGSVQLGTNYFPQCGCTGNCATCQNQADHCITCINGTVLTQNQCIYCTGATFLSKQNGGVCVSCDESCATCSGPQCDQCLTCADSSDLASNSNYLRGYNTCNIVCPGQKCIDPNAQNQNSACVCNSGYLFNPNTTLCQQNSCRTDSNFQFCITCAITLSNQYICTQAQDGYQIVNGIPILSCSYSGFNMNCGSGAQQWCCPNSYTCGDAYQCNYPICGDEGNQPGWCLQCGSSDTEVQCNTVEVNTTDIFDLPAFNYIQWGYSAGDDTMDGQISINGENQQQISNNAGTGYYNSFVWSDQSCIVNNGVLTLTCDNLIMNCYGVGGDHVIWVTLKIDVSQTINNAGNFIQIC